MTRAKLIIDSTKVPSHTEKHLDELGVYIHRVPDRWTYAARVEDSRGKTIWADNGGTVAVLMAEGLPIVAAVRVLETVGHVVETWRSVVDRAAKEDW